MPRPWWMPLPDWANRFGEPDQHRHDGFVLDQRRFEDAAIDLVAALTFSHATTSIADRRVIW
ncbi:MAG: hypothetical protein AAF645_01660 [Myxococcota bacterium]